MQQPLIAGQKPPIIMNQSVGLKQNIKSPKLHAKNSNTLSGRAPRNDPVGRYQKLENDRVKFQQR